MIVLFYIMSLQELHIARLKTQQFLQDIGFNQGTLKTNKPISHQQSFRLSRDILSVYPERHIDLISILCIKGHPTPRLNWQHFKKKVLGNTEAQHQRSVVCGSMQFIIYYEVIMHNYQIRTLNRKKVCLKQCPVQRKHFELKGGNQTACLYQMHVTISYH